MMAELVMEGQAADRDIGRLRLNRFGEGAPLLPEHSYANRATTEERVPAGPGSDAPAEGRASREPNLLSLAASSWTALLTALA